MIKLLDKFQENCPYGCPCQNADCEKINQPENLAVIYDGWSGKY